MHTMGNRDEGKGRKLKDNTDERNRGCEENLSQPFFIYQKGCILKGKEEFLRESRESLQESYMR